jgi:nucleoid-associated protein YejK
MTQLKEKGHNIDLTNIVIHRINKAAGNKASVLKLAKEELKVNKPEIHFIADIRESFNKKSIPTHGIFEESFDYNIFQQSIKKYIDKKIDFMKFTTSSMDYYKRIIDASAPATGGFMIFADFKITDNRDERYILIFSINNKQGYNLSETALSIQQIKNLELNKMDLATFINISRWNIARKNSNEVKTYLSFIRGKKKISDYFQNFIGCADKTTATESSTKLLNTINQYCSENGYDESKKKEIKRKIFEYCQDCNKQKKEILLSHISSLIDDENPDNFSVFASGETYAISDVIKYDSKVLRSLKYIVFQSEDFSIKINKQLVGKTAKYSKERGTLTITNLPEDLTSQF